MSVGDLTATRCPCDGEYLLWTEGDVDRFASCCYFEYYATMTPDHDYVVTIITNYALKRQLELEEAEVTEGE